MLLASIPIPQYDFSNLEKLAACYNIAAREAIRQYEDILALPIPPYLLKIFLTENSEVIREMQINLFIAYLL